MSTSGTGRPPRVGPSGHGADLLLRNGRVYVGAGAGDGEFADSVAVRDGRIVAVGSDSELAGQAHAETRVVDVGGRTVIPGLIDSHLHLVRAGLTWTEEVRWFEVATLQRALSLLHEMASQRPQGTWLRVIGGWHPGQFEEGRGPTSEELTRLFPDNPVYVQLLYEDAVLNDAAMRACGIVEGCDDPDLGVFLRDPSGRPTGTIRGVGAFMHCLSCMPPPSPTDAVEGTRQMLAELHAYGLVGGIDAGGLGMAPESYEPIFVLWRQNELTFRTRLYVGPQTRGAELPEVNSWLRHTHPGFGDRWLRHVGLGELTMFGCHDLEGLREFVVDDATRNDLAAMLDEAASRRWPVHMHSVLDSTTSAILDVWERLAATHDIASLRWSLAHIEPISTHNLDRVAALGAGLAVQDRLVYRAADSAKVWGDDAVRGGPPLRAILQRGIPLGAGTDSTRVASPNPWVSLWWLVTGKTVDGGPARDPAQCLSRAEALDAYTSGSAWFSGEESERGRLQAGMVADVTVLSDDYFTVGEDEIRQLTAALTIVDGRPVHVAPDIDLGDK